MCRIVDTCMQLKIRKHMDFSAGPVGKNLPANAGDMGSMPGPGRSMCCGAAKPKRHSKRSPLEKAQLQQQRPSPAKNY